MEEKIDELKRYYRRINSIPTKPKVYVKGTPLYNSYLKPPYSYLVWRNAQKGLPPPPRPPIDVSSKLRNLNYNYYLESLKTNNLDSPSEDSGSYSDQDKEAAQMSSPENNAYGKTRKYHWEYFDESFIKLFDI